MKVLRKINVILLNSFESGWNKKRIMNSKLIQRIFVLSLMFALSVSLTSYASFDNDLIEPSYRGDVLMLKALLNKDADVNAKANNGTTALYVKGTDGEIYEEKESSISELQRLAKNGEIEAQFRLGVACMEGRDTEMNLERAIFWFEQVVKDRESKYVNRATRILTNIYKHGGRGVSRNLKRVIEINQEREDFNKVSMFHFRLGGELNTPIALLEEELRSPKAFDDIGGWDVMFPVEVETFSITMMTGRLTFDRGAFLVFGFNETLLVKVFDRDNNWISLYDIEKGDEVEIYFNTKNNPQPGSAGIIIKIRMLNNN